MRRAKRGVIGCRRVQLFESISINQYFWTQCSLEEGTHRSVSLGDDADGCHAHDPPPPTTMPPGSCPESCCWWHRGRHKTDEKTIEAAPDCRPVCAGKIERNKAFNNSITQDKRRRRNLSCSTGGKRRESIHVRCLAEMEV